MAKRKYNTWKQEDMNEALQKHRNGEIGFNEACRRFNIPKPTLRRYLKGLNKRTKFGRPNDMSPEMEEILAQHLVNLESCFFGLTATEFRKLAFELAEKFQLPHRFNKEKKIAGKKWYYRFMKEHPTLSLRVPEPTSMARSKGFNKERVNEFFDKYEEILDRYKFAAHQIYNMDETALSTVHKPSKVVAQKGKHQVGAITSGERGLTTTGICAMNAAGEFIPPMLIFKRSRLNDALKKGAPPNTEFGCSKNGWITSELFVQWLQHFIKCTRLEKSDRKQILLVLDGHSTHTKNLEAIQMARDYGIVMLSFPAHTTHRLQPLDRSFFKSLKSCYNEAASSWLRSNPGSVIKQANVAELLGKAYPRSVRMDIALNGFKATGLWPCDRNVIKEEDFVASVYISDPSNQE
ncbi:PREDICTED: tigger transposable element-derived protein 6-like, partial [Vollenhovia emeryi]|uniref:tigger transposable element-derived protein 6-like n=1 Tax=Vollenhovia emeryi TaxID=411798 RepID=UPI0005F40810